MTAPAKVLSPNRLATIVAAAAPIATGHFMWGTRPFAGANRDTGGGPEHCNAIRFCQHRKAKPRRQEMAIPTAIARPMARVGSATSRRHSSCPVSL